MILRQSFVRSLCLIAVFSWTAVALAEENLPTPRSIILATEAEKSETADDSREAVEKNHGQRANPQKGGAYGERFAFVMEPIDKRADRRLRNKSGNARRRDGHADVSRIPMQRRGEINREKRADAGVHISHEKVDRVQRAKCALARCGLDWTHKPNI